MCGHSIGRRIFTTTRFAAFILMLEDNMKKGLQNNHLGFLEDYDNHNLNSDKKILCQTHNDRNSNQQRGVEL